MAIMHPLRTVAAKTDVTILDMGRRFGSALEPRDEVEDSVATVAAVGEMLDRMQTQIEEQAALISAYKREISELTMHKEAAYGEMTKAEVGLRAERDRADRAERLCEQLTASERDAQDKIKRLIVSVRSTFSRAEQAARIAS